MKLLTTILLLFVSIACGEEEASEHYKVVFHKKDPGDDVSCVIEERKSGKVMHDLSSLFFDGSRPGLRHVSWATDERHVLIAYYNVRWDDQYVLLERRGRAWHELKLPDFPQCGLRMVKPDDSFFSYIDSAEWQNNQRLILGHDVRIGDWHHPSLRFAAKEQLQIRRDGSVVRSVIGQPVPFDDEDERSGEMDKPAKIKLVTSGKRIKLLRNNEILALFDDVLKKQLGIKQVRMACDTNTPNLNLSEAEQKGCGLIDSQFYVPATGQLYFSITVEQPELQAWYAYEIKTGKVRLLLDYADASGIIREVNSLKIRAEGRILNKLRWSDHDARLSKKGELVVNLIDDSPDVDEVQVEARIRLLKGRAALTACDVIR